MADLPHHNRQSEHSSGEDEFPPAPARTLLFATDSPSNSGAGNSPLLNEQLGQYRINGLLGHGGMALVYSATDGDGAPVALKTMEETPLLPAHVLQRFQREAEAAKILRSHPNIITVYDTGEHGTTHYIAMELIPNGMSLEKLLREHEGRLPISDALKLAIPIAQALGYAHSKGIVHRDLKPGNVLLSEFGEPLLADFGIARLETSADSNLTQLTLGTPGYMSPEQTMSSKVQAASDIYSFGVLLYEMVTGHLPYDFSQCSASGSIFEIIRHKAPISPRKYRPEISKNLKAVLLTLLEKNPQHRYPSMSQVALDLEACLNHSPVTVRRPSPLEQLTRTMNKHRQITVGIVLAAALVLALSLRFQKQLRAEREASLISTLAATGADRELAQFKRQLAPQTPDLSPASRLKQVHLLLADGKLQQAQTELQKLLVAADRAKDSGLQAVLQREQARLHIALKQYQKAATVFAQLSEGSSDSAGRHLASFEEGLCFWLAGERSEARSKWQALKQAPNLEPHFAFLCQAALAEIHPSQIVSEAADRPTLIRALALWLASEQTPADQQKQAWIRQAREEAGETLPWLGRQ
jgi:serine/threonine-protein kinase